jgi:hypothetical protein
MLPDAPKGTQSYRTNTQSIAAGVPDEVERAVPGTRAQVLLSAPRPCLAG